MNSNGNICVDNESTEKRSISRTFGHVFRDDVDGLLGHHGVQRHQLVVSELLHDLSLLEEGFGRHGACLQGLDGHLSCAVPRAFEGPVGQQKITAMSSPEEPKKSVLLEETVSRDRESTTNRGSDCRKWIMFQFGHRQSI